MKWFEFSQNNSGGGFHVDEMVTHRVFIQAPTEEEAEKKAFALGVYYDGVYKGVDCDCCGDRWYPPSELKLTKLDMTIEEYAKFLKNNYGWCNPDAYIYYADKTKVTI